jgi:hypothetical protein
MSGVILPAGPVAQHHKSQPDEARRVGLVEHFDRGFGVARAPEHTGEVDLVHHTRSSKSM